MFVQRVIALDPAHAADKHEGPPYRAVSGPVGGHIDAAILVALQVSSTGDLANWMIPGKMVKGMGGAMDLVHGARRVIVIVEHSPRRDTQDRQRVHPAADRPRAVNRIITDLAVLDVTSDRRVLRELAPGVSADAVRSRPTRQSTRICGRVIAVR